MLPLLDMYRKTFSSSSPIRGSLLGFVRSDEQLSADDSIEPTIAKTSPDSRTTEVESPEAILATDSEAPIVRASVLTKALRWKAFLGCPGSSNKAELSITLGVSRARVTQVMSVLEVSDAVREALEAAEARGVTVTERMWRGMKGLGDADVIGRLKALGMGSKGERMLRTVKTGDIDQHIRNAFDTRFNWGSI